VQRGLVRVGGLRHRSRRSGELGEVVLLQVAHACRQHERRPRLQEQILVEQLDLVRDASFAESSLVRLRDTALGIEVRRRIRTSVDVQGEHDTTMARTAQISETRGHVVGLDVPVEHPAIALSLRAGHAGILPSSLPRP
jgi:hypothetical protein